MGAWNTTGCTTMFRLITHLVLLVHSHSDFFWYQLWIPRMGVCMYVREWMGICT
jgi:hypothetical protein